MKILILFIIISLVSFSSIFADDFGIVGNVDTSQLYITTALGYSLEPLDIEYNEVDVSEPYQEKTFSDYANFLGDAYRRIIGEGDRVVVPPGTKIQVYSLLRNDSDHDIQVKNFSFFASRVNSMWGTWENLGVFGYPGSMSYKIYGSNRTRTGIRIDWPTSFNILPSEEKTVLAGEFKLPNFLKVLEESHIPKYAIDGSLIVEHSIKVKNDSNVAIGDVVFTHGAYLFRRNFLPNEEFSYEYSVDYGFNYQLGENTFLNYSISVTPEIHECVVIGSSVLTRNNVPDSRSIFLLRNDENNLSQFLPIKEIDWYPGNEGLCIDVLPYWIFGKEVKLSITPVSELSMEVKDNRNVEITLNSLGAKTSGILLNFIFDNKYIYPKNVCDASVNDSVLEWTIVGRSFSCNLQFELVDTGKYSKSTILSFENSNYKREMIEVFPDIEFEVTLREGNLHVLNNSQIKLNSFKFGEREYVLEKGENIFENNGKENYSYSEIVGSVENL